MTSEDTPFNILDALDKAAKAKAEMDRRAAAWSKAQEEYKAIARRIFKDLKSRGFLTHIDEKYFC